MEKNATYKKNKNKIKKNEAIMGFDPWLSVPQITTLARSYEDRRECWWKLGLWSSFTHGEVDTKTLTWRQRRTGGAPGWRGRQNTDSAGENDVQAVKVGQWFILITGTAPLGRCWPQVGE